ncbi:hypothetical protein BVX98_06710 [bacterium F11]|nr:hypothetical protein BVX98_06710 [bacterium F11]
MGMKRTAYWTFLSFSFLAVCLCLIHAVRGRSFWLDEAFVAESLILRTPYEILFGGVLINGQLFPKVYLFIIKLLFTGTPLSTFWPRFLPLLFGLAGIIVWLLFYFQNYFVREKKILPFVIAAGLLIGNTYTIYYAFELKQYSAELLFSGLFFFFLFTDNLSSRVRTSALVLTAILSLFFTYTSILVIGAVFMFILLREDQREEWKGKVHLLIAFAIGVVGVLIFLYAIDYRNAMGTNLGNGMSRYWVDFMAHGSTFLAKIESVLDLLKTFLTDWWKTGYGPMNERFSNNEGWFILGKSLIRNPDLRNGIYYFTLFLMLQQLYRLFVKRDKGKGPLQVGTFLICLMILAAYMKKYPFGMMRLSLYALPIAILFIVETISTLQSLALKIPYFRKIHLVFWIPIIWIVFRNIIFVTGSFLMNPFRQDVQLAYKMMDPEKSSIMIARKGNDPIFNNNPGRPNGIKLIHESDIIENRERLDDLKDKPLYYMWAHFLPKRNEKGIPILFAKTHRAEDILVRPPILKLGLLLLTPREKISSGKSKITK